MDQEQEKLFKERLIAEKDRLMKQIERLENDGLGMAMSQSLGELSQYDNHPADVGDELFQRSKDIALRDNSRILLSEVETALERIDNHTYGICEVCGGPIATERLDALVSATKCIDCQSSGEDATEHQRPIEEYSLSSPFYRSFLDHADNGYTGYDGEDALQDVMKYGSSDGPQDIPGTHDYKDLYPNSHERPGIVEGVDDIPSNEKRTRY